MQMKPFLLVGHRCITPDSARNAIQAGANCVEFDIRHYNGAFMVSHDHRLWSPSTPLADYLANLKALSNEFEHFSALVVDIKREGMNKARMSEVLNFIHTSVTDETGLIIIISIGEYERREEFSTIVGSLRSNECISIDSDDDPAKVAGYFISLRAQNWAYANGIASPFRSHKDIKVNVDQAARMKKNGGIFKFVYAWAPQKKATMRSYLRIGVDGLLVDNVGHLASVLAEPEFAAEYVLATRNDDLFATNYLGRFLGDRRSMEVHDLYTEDRQANGCQIEAIFFRNREHFKDVSSALKQGYRSCSKCFSI
jgi:glycerophosphoryl diester phosphodiesterase